MSISNKEAISILKNAAFLSTKTSFQGIEEAVDMAIEALKAQDVTDINAGNNDLINRVDVEQTVEDNILCYTHSDRPIDQDPDTECHMAIRTALRMLRKDLRKLPSAQPDDWLTKNKDKILKAGLEGRECDFYIGGRLFAIREKAQ